MTGGSFLDYGVVLHNRSSGLSALGVRVTITVTVPGEGGTDSYETEVTGIPPGGWFYLSPGLPMVGAQSLKGLKVAASVAVARTVSGRVHMPPVSVTINQAGLLPQAVGVVRNPYPDPNESNWGDILSGYFSVLYFNARGRIVGAESTDPNYDLRGGGYPNSPTLSFTLSDVPPVGATSAQASIDPCSDGANFWGLSRSCVAIGPA
jgi:hypothetical protein